jgi:nitrous oxide reductase accessory protein NosL
MLVDDAPRWIAGVVNETGKPQRFCSPRCMFAWLRSPRGQASRDPWVTEYYTQEQTPVEEVLFVAGSNVIGPMGESLVPVKGREEAERFRQDHHGTNTYSAAEITREVLREIAGQDPSR